MKRTTRPTKALALCGAYGRAGDTELRILALADEYRGELCRLIHRQHRAEIDLRIRLFPELWAAMQHAERCYWKVDELELQIKAHHSDVRDKNAVTAEQRAQLTTARQQLATAAAELRRQRAPWLALPRAYRAELKAAVDAQTRKNCKTLADRRQMYRAITWSNSVREYARLQIAFDLRHRRLDEAYQARGLHYAIRGEIRAASERKFTLDGPGMRYSYSRAPEPQPWQKLTLQFGSGGLKVSDALAGNCPSFRMRLKYINLKASGREYVYDVRQQIGTNRRPTFVEYAVKLHRPVDETALIQRWSLIVDKSGRRSVVPILSNMDFRKPIGSGDFAFRLGWSSHPNGVQVAHLFGDHVNERVVLPQWLVADRMAVKDTQQQVDDLANEALEARGEPISKAPGARQGFAALEEFVQRHPNDLAAANLLDSYQARLDQAEKVRRRSVRTIRKIYETVARRVCSRHARVLPPKIDLKRTKRYKKRDLLREDPLSKRSREVLHAVAPGKLRALLTGYGLETLPLEGKPLDAPGPEAPTTDLFTSYVRGIGTKTGRKTSRPNRRIDPRKGDKKEDDKRENDKREEEGGDSQTRRAG